MRAERREGTETDTSEAMDVEPITYMPSFEDTAKEASNILNGMEELIKFTQFYSVAELYHWDQMRLALAFKEKNEEMKMTIQVNSETVIWWWTGESIHRQALLCFTILQGDVIPNDTHRIQGIAGDIRLLIWLYYVTLWVGLGENHTLNGTQRAFFRANPISRIDETLEIVIPKEDIWTTAMHRVVLSLARVVRLTMMNNNDARAVIGTMTRMLPQEISKNKSFASFL